MFETDFEASMHASAPTHKDEVLAPENAKIIKN